MLEKVVFFFKCMGKQHKVKSWGDQKIWHESKSTSVDLKNAAELVRV